MQSITLQTSDSAITAGDILGRINFAASSEGDGGAAKLEVGSIYSYAEGTFSSAANPASIIIATSASDTSPAQPRLKVTNEGHVLPAADSSYDLGSSSLAFRNTYTDTLYIGGTAITATAAELNKLDGVTATTAELNKLDGVTATTTELNRLDGITATTAELNILDGVTATATELNLLDGVTAITLGSANELLVVGSDGASIVSDSTLAVDTTNNRLGINQTSPEVTLHMTGEDAQTAQIRMEQYNNSADAPDVRTRRYRGTIASPSAVQAGDYLFRSNHEYYNGTSLIVGGTLGFDNTNNANRTQFAVSVTTDGTSADTNTASKVQFKIDGNDSGAITFNNAYKFPTSDGSANQFLQTNGAGTVSFASATVSDISDLTATAAELNKLDGVTATTAELNKLDGITATTTELNYTDGVTSNIQTQLNAKAALASPSFTGTPLAPTASAGTNTTQLATTAFVSTAVANLVASAPTTLDTLNELAAALGDDANFSTTVTNSIATKLTASNNLSDLTDATTARSELGLGSLATLSAVGAAQITDNTVGAAELNVTGNGTTAQF